MLDRFRVKLLSMPRRWKRLLQVATDILLVWLSLWLAFVVRLGTDDMIDISASMRGSSLPLRLSPFHCSFASACIAR